MRKWPVIWVLAISLLSFAPLPLKLRLHTTGRWHDLGHFAVFLFTGLAAWALARKPARRVTAIAGVCLWGLTLEGMEAVFWHNPMEWGDVRMDALGATLGFAISAMLPLIWNRLHGATR